MLDVQFTHPTEILLKGLGHLANGDQDRGARPLMPRSLTVSSCPAALLPCTRQVLFEEVFKILPQVWPSPQDEEEDEDVGQQGTCWGARASHTSLARFSVAFGFCVRVLQVGFLSWFPALNEMRAQSPRAWAASETRPGRACHKIQ